MRTVPGIVALQDGGMHCGAQNFERIHFGLGPHADVKSLLIECPSGLRQELRRGVLGPRPVRATAAPRPPRGGGRRSRPLDVQGAARRAPRLERWPGTARARRGTSAEPRHHADHSGPAAVDSGPLSTRGVDLTPAIGRGHSPTCRPSARASPTACLQDARYKLVAYDRTRTGTTQFLFDKTTRARRTASASPSRRSPHYTRPRWRRFSPRWSSGRDGPSQWTTVCAAVCARSTTCSEP